MAEPLKGLVAKMVELIGARIDLEQQTLRTYLELFLTWYAFFWTLNVAALAWVFGRTRPVPDDEHSAGFRRWISIGFAVLNVTALGTCCFSGLVMTRASKATLALQQSLPQAADLPAAYFAAPMPASFLWWVTLSAAFTVVGASVMWGCLAWHTRRPAVQPSGA